MVWKLFLWSSLRKSYSICRENSDMAEFWPFKTKIWSFLAKIDSFESFWPITSKRRYESFYFFVWKLFLWSSLRKSYSICRENSDMAKFWPWNSENLVHLRPILEFWSYNFQMPLWIFLNFCMEVVVIVFFEKIILYMPGKFWYGKILAM